MLGSCDLLTFLLTGDAARAKAFYRDTLGLKFTGEDEYAVVFDAKGVMLRVSVVPGFTPSEHPVLGWIVPDIRATTEQLAKAGVTFERYLPDQDELGIWSAPGGAPKVAWFKDPDGNVLSISQL